MHFRHPDLPARQYNRNRGSILTLPLPKVPGYRLGRFLGKGAGSRIYSVRNLKTGQVLVLKHVLREKPQDERYIVQVLNEYRLGSKVNHPVLRRILEVRKKGLLAVREVMLFMEPVKGSHLEENQPTDLAEILKIMLAVSEGLASIHELGFVHADLNPRNVIISKSGRVKLIDYGLSCPIGTVKERVQGTLDYLAPEQARMEQIDHRTDIFNFAAVLYWLATSRTIGSPAIGEKLGQRHNLTDPRKLNPNIPESFGQLLLKCLAEDKDARLQTSRQVSELLRAELAEMVKLPPEKRRVQLVDQPISPVSRTIPLINPPTDNPRPT